MKKTATALVIGMFLITPLVSSASILDDLQAQVASLTAIVQSLQARLIALGQTKVSTGTNLAAVGAINSSSITVVSPNGGETLTRGTPTTISWQGGKGEVSIALVNVAVTNQTNPGVGQNLLVGWIATKKAPGSSVSWNVQTVCGLGMTQCSNVLPGSYKVMAISQDANGNLVMWDHKKNSAGNWDVSNAAFTIK